MGPSLPFQLDPATLLFSIASSALLMGLVSFSLTRQSPRERLGLAEWGWAMLCTGAAMLLMTGRPWLPVWLGFGLGNLLVATCPALVTAAHARVLERPTPWRALLLWWVVGAVGALVPHLPDGSRHLAATLIALATVGMLSLALRLLWRAGRRRRLVSTWLSFSLLAALTAGYALRALQMALGLQADAAPVSASRSQIGLLLAAALFIHGASLGFFFMVQDRQRREAEDQARRDVLTGLFTRAGFDELAHRLDAAGEPARYAVVMVDLDHFKAVNDTYGHLAGDLMLAHAARRIAQNIRLVDLAGRYGGEEFCVLLRDAGEAEAARFSQRLVRDAAGQAVRLRDGQAAQYTLSAGYACREGPEPLLAVIERADQGLYSAKREGRNCARPGPPRTTVVDGLARLSVQTR